MNEQYEVEIKVEVSARNGERWLAELLTKIRSLHGQVCMTRLETTDTYVFASPVAMVDRYDYSYVRVRRDQEYDQGRFVKATADITTKKWETVGNTFTRKETVGSLTLGGYEFVLGLFPNPDCTISKKRQASIFQVEFASGSTHQAVVACDQVIFSGATQSRFFVEAEIIVEHKSQVSEARDALRRLLKQVLDVAPDQNLHESPSYFALAMQGK